MSRLTVEWSRGLVATEKAWGEGDWQHLGAADDEARARAMIVRHTSAQGRQGFLGLRYRASDAHGVYLRAWTVTEGMRFELRSTPPLDLSDGPMQLDNACAVCGHELRFREDHRDNRRIQRLYCDFCRAFSAVGVA